MCTNGLLSKTLAAVRSMGKMGIRTIVAEKTRHHTSGYSKYAAKTLVYPDPQKDPSAFYRWLRETIIHEKVDFLFPMDDDVMDIVVANQDELRQICHIPVPSEENYRIAANKSLTMRLAQQQGVPHPRTVETDFDTDFEHERLLESVEHLTYPFVIKPRYGSGSRGIRFVHDAEELLRLYQEIHAANPNPLIQEAVPYGGKYGVCLCYDSEHNLKGVFIQKELRNYPNERGPSTVRESVVHDVLLAHSLRLMEGIPWYGVVTVEYMVDPRTGEPKLMEINPRYWASLHLAVECGVDFPRLQYQIGMGMNPTPIFEYPTGVLGRQLLPGDLLYFLTYKNRWRMTPSFFSTQMHDDIISWHDKGPALGFILSALRYSLSLKMWKFIITR